MDEQIATFIAFTSSTPEQAQRFLQLTDGNVEQAVELFFSNPDLANQPSETPASSVLAQAHREAPIMIDSDENEELEGTNSGRAHSASVEDDEAMARRLQQEMYGAVGNSSGEGSSSEAVRAPIARTAETLVGPGSYDYRQDPGQMNAAIAQQLFSRGPAPRGPPAGIFNQRESASIWNNDDPNNPEVHRQTLSRATGGASEATAKSTLLADLFRPPVDLICPLSLADARDEGRAMEKWILVNVQDPSIFDCQVLNRDIWKHPQIRDTIKEHFLFLQYNKDDPRGSDYVNYYFSQHRDNDASYPHIAIIDPRTGEQVKTWSGSPSPKSADFLMDLHEFLDRYSLNMTSKNPVQTKRKEAKRDVSAMSEEEQLELAMQASMGQGADSVPTAEDPDTLTRPSDTVNGKGKAPVTGGGQSANAAVPPLATPFSRISSSNPHEEPASTDPTETTRIQFRHSGGRVIRRFQLSDPVSRIYEWLKASPVEGKEGAPFELISPPKGNLIDQLHTTIEEAGLKNASVMVEYVEE